MADLLTPAARPVVEAAESGADLPPHEAPQALRTLETEVTTARRIGAGTGAVALGLLGGLLAAAAADGGGAVLWGAALVLLAGAAAVAVVVVRDGRRVVSAVRRWVGASPAGGSPASVISRLLSGRAILRSALAAATLIGLLFALTLVYLGFASDDPGDLGDSATSMGVLGVVAGVVCGVAAWCLVATELKVGWALNTRVAAGRR